MHELSRFGPPTVKDGCGIFGVIRKKHAPQISNWTVISGISCIKYRGSSLGAGYASFENASAEQERPYKIKAFVRNHVIAERIEDHLNRNLGPIDKIQLGFPEGDQTRFGIWQADLTRSNCDTLLEQTVDNINSTLLSDRIVDGRIFSFGRHVNVYKEVGYPAEVAELTGLSSDSKQADLWIAHTRQPTNSPGRFPIWSHPFASLECAIVHNGDISSFGANMELLNTWGLRSHCGTDSEVIARLLDHLIRVEGLTVTQAARVLSNPFERNISEDTIRLLLKHKGARLDGPFAVVAGYSKNDDSYLIALTDRSKFRPVVIGEDEGCYYVASEESQIRTVSKNAKIWTPEPGSFFIASVKRGLIEPGNSRNLYTQHSILCDALEKTRTAAEPETINLDAEGTEFHELNESISRIMREGNSHVRIKNVSGQRYLGIGASPGKNGISKEFKIRIEGFPGNCLANLNDGASFEIFGNVADDVADTMHDGSVVIHGNARDVIGQALQGGSIFVRGSVGNRAAIQMREYKTKRPYLIIGETADDYLAEYVAGGLVMVLNLSDSPTPVGSYIGTGMVGGKIYVRGKVSNTQVGMPPKKEDILNFLKASMIDNTISKATFEEVSDLEYPSESQLEKLLPHELFARIRFLFFSGKYIKRLLIEHRRLQPPDLNILGEKLKEFFEAFKLPSTLFESILESEFTVISVAEEKPETPLPPQEVPVEE
ncbi:MAG TPA: glutamate synthase [Candidatus Bathyarchaeia archaeon]|nr:glutamate synthase [Candidatus Bathyarchaeia archaeon]